MIDPNNYEYLMGHHRLNFGKVADPVNWKMPTKSIIVSSEVEAKHIREAVIYYTGSVPDVVKLDDNNFGISSATGYYAEIGA
jgi:hypothetical protein